ncbi:MAG: peptidoglycan editing factor PgeF [Rhodocyclaceae bacterium]
MNAAAPVFLPLDWPLPAGVHARVTTRQGGHSAAPYDSLNLGTHVGDDAQAVHANRQSLRAHLPAEPAWLNQVHGVAVADAAQVGAPIDADAAVAHAAGIVCAVMTADCLPVLLARRDGQVVAAAHAGWRSLVGGVLEATVARMGGAGEALTAYLGPAIGPDRFEVGPEVRDAFMRHDAVAAKAFRAGQGDRWLADIYLLARQRLHAMGIAPDAIYGGHLCTVTDSSRFFSYRRDGKTGRMAALIWRV